VVLAGDGQVTLGESVIKHTAKKIAVFTRTRSLAGFAGSTVMHFHYSVASNLSLSSIHGNWAGQPVELAKDWRTDKFLRHLEACFWFPTGNKRFYSVVRET
jgi:ATP-dependent HslUV protease subunit HslV